MKDSQAVANERYASIVPERIAARRAYLGLSQAEVVDRMRVLANRGGFPSESWYSRVESGVFPPAMDDAMLLAEALGTSVGFLCGETHSSVPGWDRLQPHTRAAIEALLEVDRASQAPRREAPEGQPQEDRGTG